MKPWSLLAVVATLLMALHGRGDGSAAVDCQRLLDDAVAAHASEVTIPPGVHRVPPGGGAYHLHVKDARSCAGGRSPPRLLSAGADAFHSACVRRGPVVEDCLFEAIGDDGIAIHGMYSLATRARESPRR